MRTVEQVTTELSKAREVSKAAKLTEDKLVKELQAIYNTAKAALGIEEYQPR